MQMDLRKLTKIDNIGTALIRPMKHPCRSKFEHFGGRRKIHDRLPADAVSPAIVIVMLMEMWAPPMTALAMSPHRDFHGWKQTFSKGMLSMGGLAKGGGPEATW